MTKRYPLHYEDAEPLYKEITQDEYDRLVKADLELKNLQKKVFDFAGRVIDHESEARKPAIRWHIVATDGNPSQMGRYFTIREDRTGMWVDDSYYEKKSWYKGLKVVAWISRQEMLESGLDVLAKVKK